MSDNNEVEKYVAALDIGTTTIRCFIYDSNCQIKGVASNEVSLIYEGFGHVEINPDILWDTITETVRNAIIVANLQPNNITSIGISTQRSTFITWDKFTGRTYHNFITWKDLRADSLVKKWNASFTLKTIHSFCYCLFLLTRNKRFLAGSVLKFMNTQTTLRLHWIIQNNRELQDAIKKKIALFGTLDSWLLYRLRKGNVPNKYIEHISDVTNCAATGFYDPFTLTWANWAISLFSINESMLPKVVENSYEFGYIDKSVFGHEIQIGCVISDQSASMWGSCCFAKGDVKITLGTGSFLNVNTSTQCHASIKGLYPLVAWNHKNQLTNKNEVIYCVEGAFNDSGSIIKWAIDFGLFSDPMESSDIANSVESTDGVYFIPAFSGLGAPINDYNAATGLIGIRPTTVNANIVRALLESIAFRITQLYFCTQSETDFSFSIIRVDGGVSKNNFICQLLADLTGLSVERATSSELSALGVGFLAGLNTGIWKDRQQLMNLRKIDNIFVPRKEHQDKCLTQMNRWEQAANRFKSWYDVKD